MFTALPGQARGGGKRETGREMIEHLAIAVAEGTAADGDELPAAIAEVERDRMARGSSRNALVAAGSAKDSADPGR